MISFTFAMADGVRVRGAFLTSGVVVVVDMAFFLLGENPNIANLRV
jgi:hypothetical protein